MVARLLLVLGLLAAATPALADGDNVVVLGLRSIEGDDDVANDVTDRLREGVATVPGWIASPTAVSMSQMSLAHGCDELDAACLGDIARGLQADRIIYGTVRRTTAREDYDFARGLSLYDAQAGAITKQVDDTVPRAEANYDALGPRVEKLLGRLSSTLQGGAIAVQVNVPDADVRVNGQSVGKARDGSLRLEGLQDGQYRIEVHKDGFTPHVSTVTIVEGTETMLSAVLNREGIDPADYPAEASSGHELAWLGWSLIGVSGAALVGTGVAMLRINSIDEEELLNTYRNQVAIGNVKAREEGTRVFNDVCDAAEGGFEYELQRSDIEEVADLCAEADTWEVLQWVFVGTAVVAGGVGTYLVLTAEPESNEQVRRSGPASRWAIQPSVGHRSARVTATLQF